MLIQKGFHVGDFQKMKKFDQTPYKLPPPTPIHVPAEKRPLEEKSLPFSKKRSKVRITPVMRRVSRRSETCADSTLPTITCVDSSVTSPTVTCADSSCSRTCAYSSVTSPTATYADSTCIRTTFADSTCIRTTCADSTCIRNCADSRCSRTCADSSVTSPTATYADFPRTYADSTCIRTCADSRCSRTCADSRCSRTCTDSSVTSPTVTCADSSVQVPQPPMQLLPELDTLDPLESTDAFDQFMPFVFGPQELQLLHSVPSIFDGDLFSFLDEFERAPMDWAMPRLNSCVKKSIGFKPIQPMDLSVNSSIGQ
ncbi:uncharacterized protein TNCV_200671 [Trichonephila clavipes]|nr:uncharacterized protein TNCV_200671 [Trichonephila clavipes]